MEIDWSKWSEHLGKMPDSELARRVGTTTATVAYWRGKLGVKSFCTTNNRINWKKWDAILGTASDRAIARKIGCHRTSVADRRRSLGVISSHKGIDWSPWTTLLGTISDRELAKRVGCSRSAIVAKRLALGIKPWKERVGTTQRRVVNRPAWYTPSWGEDDA